MGTRSRIAVMHGSVCKSVYCHWDGYLDHNGRILQEYYDSAKANNLVALGDLSSLRPNIGEKHAFSKLEVPMDGEAYDKLYGDMTTFYGRDRGEEGCDFKVAHTFEEFLEYNDGTDALYELENGELIPVSSESEINQLIAVFLLIYFSQLGISANRLITFINSLFIKSFHPFQYCHFLRDRFANISCTSVNG